MPIRRAGGGKVPGSGGFARHRSVLDLAVEREGARIDRQRRVEDDRYIRGTPDRLDHGPQPGGAPEAPKAPGDELPQQPRAAFRSVIVEYQVAVTPDQLDLLDPGECGYGLAGLESSHGLLHQPEVAENATTQHPGVD